MCTLIGCSCDVNITAAPFTPWSAQRIQMERHEDKNGRRGPVGYNHSWDSTYLLANIILFQVARHAVHHMHSTLWYQLLGADGVQGAEVRQGQ